MATADWASVAAAAFAAGAATAAWATVGLSLRRDRALHKPNVAAGFTVQELSKRPEIVFSNGGPGLAVGLAYLTVIHGRTFGGYVGTGLLQPGAEWRERLDLLMSSEGQVPLVWLCRDVENNAHVWAYDGGYRRFDRKLVVDPNREGFTLADHFRRMYPNVPLP